MVGNKDEQELAGEAQQQMGTEEDGKGHESKETNSDEPASSPIGDEGWDATVQTLTGLAGEHDVLSVEGFDRSERVRSRGLKICWSFERR